MTRQFFLAVLALPLLVSVCGCGKKERNPFQFNELEKKTLPTLRFPSVKKARLEADTLTWQVVSPAEMQTLQTWVHQQEGHENVDVSLVGYNVYGFTSGGFIARTPLNRRPLSTTSFSLPKNTRHDQFLIRAVFSVGKDVYEGSASRIVQRN